MSGNAVRKWQQKELFKNFYNVCTHINTRTLLIFVDHILAVCIEESPQGPIYKLHNVGLIN